MSIEMYEQQLRRLLSKQAITELAFAYSRAVDRRDFSLLKSLYTTDGYDDHGGYYCGDIAGYVDWLSQAMDNCEITSHAVHNHSIAFSDDGSAEGEVYVTAYHRMHDGKGGYDEYIGGFRYLDNYREEGGAWRFSRRQLIIDWIRTAPASWDLDHPLLRGNTIGMAGPTDASYTLGQPLFARCATSHCVAE